MWSRRESVAFSERYTQQGAEPLLSPLCLHCSAKKGLQRILSARLQGEEHKTQVPEAIIKLPKPFLLLFNLFVAHPANNTLGY